MGRGAIYLQATAPGALVGAASGEAITSGEATLCFGLQQAWWAGLCGARHVTQHICNARAGAMSPASVPQVISLLVLRRLC